MLTEFTQADHIHFVGIGGIGVSALARMALKEGKEVSGSDAADSEIVQALKENGADISIGHAAENVPEKTDLLIYSIAVPPENPERQQANEAGIQALTYPEALGMLSEDKKTVAVAGTHGKTTTTAMLAKIAESSSLLDPTVIVGSLLSETNSNFIYGRDNTLIVEACEYKRSFLNLHPDILIITNIDNDHLDYFDGMKDITNAFEEIVEKVPSDGAVVTNPAGDHISGVIDAAAADVVDYTKIQHDFQLQVPGEHNILNAQAAIAAATQLGVAQPQAAEYIQEFSGTWRRAQMKGQAEEGALVYDDYAHHPTEIKTTLKGIKEQHPDKKLVVVFQPHLYSRTKKLLEAFPKSFSPAERIILLPIYAAREAPDASISTHDLQDALASEYPDKSIEHADNFDAAAEKLDGYMTADNLIITMGAGDVYELAEKIVVSEKAK